MDSPKQFCHVNPGKMDSSETFTLCEPWEVDSPTRPRTQTAWEIDFPKLTTSGSQAVYFGRSWISTPVMCCVDLWHRPIRLVYRSRVPWHTGHVQATRIISFSQLSTSWSPPSCCHGHSTASETRCNDQQLHTLPSRWEQKAPGYPRVFRDTGHTDQ